jgi:hypothetical protein
LAPGLAAEQFLGVDWAGDVFHMDSTTGATMFVGASGLTNVNSMARDTLGRNFVISEDALGAAQLVQLDPLTGGGSSVVPLAVAEVTGAAFGPGDVLYVTTYPTGLGLGSDLHTVDVGTGAATLVGNTTSADGIQGLTFHDGALYGWDVGYPGLVQVDVATAVATPVGLTAPFFTSVQSLFSGADGTLYGAGNELYEIDPLSGGVTMIGTSEYYVRGMESTGDFVGSPATLSVLSGGTQTLGYVAGLDFAGCNYLVLGSASGTTPGFTYGAATVPLNPDAYLTYTYLNPGNPYLPGSGGILDAAGAVQLGFVLPPGSPGTLIGMTIHHAGIVLELTGGAIAITHTSLPAPLTFTP